MMFGRQVMRTMRRHAWRARMAWRSASLSRILRHAARVLGPRYAGREKADGRWVVRASVNGQVVDVLRVVLPPVRRLEDFLVPLDVTLLRADILTMSELGAALAFARRTTPTERP